ATAWRAVQRRSPASDLQGSATGPVCAAALHACLCPGRYRIHAADPAPRRHRCHRSRPDQRRRDDLAAREILERHRGLYPGERTRRTPPLTCPGGIVPVSWRPGASARPPADEPWPLPACGGPPPPPPPPPHPQPSAKTLPAAALPLGTNLSISQWASDDAGRPWYLVSANGVSGWVWSGGVRLDQPNPTTHLVRNAPMWKPVAGKGMLFTNYV